MKTGTRLLILGLVVALALATGWKLRGRHFSPQPQGGSNEPATTEEPATANAAAGASTESTNATLGQILAQAQQVYGINVHSHLDADLQLPKAVLDGNAAQTLTNLAATLNLELCGQLTTLATATIKDVYLSSQALYVGSDPTIAESLDRLGDPDGELRADTLHELAEYVWDKEEENMEPIVDRLLRRDADERVRAAAAVELAGTRTPLVADHLVAALEDTSEQVQEHARASLGQMKSELAVPRLKQLREQSAEPAVTEIADQLLEQVFAQPLNSDLPESK